MNNLVSDVCLFYGKLIHKSLFTKQSQIKKLNYKYNYTK